MYTKTYEKHCELQEVGLEYCIYNIYYKVEVHPRRDHEGTEEEQRHSCALYLTSALDDSGWSTTGKRDPVPNVQDIGWIQGQNRWMQIAILTELSQATNFYNTVFLMS